MFETISLFSFYIAGLSLALVAQRLSAFMKGLEKFLIFFGATFGATFGVVCAVAVGSLVLKYFGHFAQ